MPVLSWSPLSSSCSHFKSGGRRYPSLHSWSSQKGSNQAQSKLLLSFLLSNSQFVANKNFQRGKSAFLPPCFHSPLGIFFRYSKDKYTLENLPVKLVIPNLNTPENRFYSWAAVKSLQTCFSPSFETFSGNLGGGAQASLNCHWFHCTCKSGPPYLILFC